jgi:PDZ domain-containing protein
MKKVLQHHRFELILSSFFFVVLVFVSLFPVKYRVIAPGFNDEVGSFIEIENAYPMDGTFHTTSVIVLDRISLIQKWVGSIEKKVSVSERPEYFNDINISDLKVSGYLSKDDSLNTSLVVGIENSHYSINYLNEYRVYLTYNILPENTLELGDVILDVNGNTDILTELANVPCEQTAVFHVLRDGTEYSFELSRKRQEDDRCLFGILVKSFTDILDSSVSYTLQDTNTGGGSGGLMQALYIFNALTPNDLTGGLNIAGTGTIAVDGSVGPIGGISQKIITSTMNGMDIFFVPHLSDDEYDNYIVAKKTLEELHSDMVLVPVTTFQDALDYLENRFGGAFGE